MPALSHPALRKEVLRVLSAFFLVAGLLVALPIVFLGVKYTWPRSRFSLDSLFASFVYLCVLWGFVTNWLRTRAARNLNAMVSWGFIAGPRPADIDELRVWWWTRQSLYAFAGIICAMGAFALLVIVRGD